MRRLFTAIGVVVLSVAVFAQGGRTPEVRFKAAQHKEEAEGDLKGALAEYRAISQGKDRPLAVRALLRMAAIHRDLGEAEAQRTYERIIKEFPEQRAAVAEARENMASLTVASGPASLRTRDVLVDGGIDGPIALSGDGRLVIGGPPITILDMRNGSSRTLPRLPRFFEGVWFKDGKRLLYVPVPVPVPNAPSPAPELHIAEIGNSDDAVGRRVFVGTEMTGLVPHGVTGDGGWVVVTFRRNGQAYLGLLALQDGSLHGVRQIDSGRTAPTVFLSPDDKYVAFDARAGSAEFERDIVVLAADIGTPRPLARQVATTSGPANDVVMGWSPDGRSLLYASETTPGNARLWALPVPDDGSSGAPRPLSVEIPPASASLGVLRTGSLFLVILRSADERHVRIGEVEGNSIPRSARLSGDFAGFNPQWSPDGTSLLYQSLAVGVGGNGAHTLTVVRDSTTQVVRPAMRGMGPARWAPDGRSFLVAGTDLQGRGPGVFQIRENGEATLLVEPGRPGSTAQQSRDGRTLDHQAGGRGGFSLMARDVTSGSDRRLVDGSVDFDLSPDGRFLAVEMGGVITLVGTAGDDRRQLIAGRLAGWAADSQTIMVQSRDQKEVWRVSLTGESRPLLSTTDAPSRVAIHPSGNRAAWEGGQAPSLGSRIVRVIDNFLPRDETPVQPGAGRGNLVSMGTARLEWRDRTGALVGRIGGAERYLNSSRPALAPDGRRLAISRLPASVPDRVPAADRWSLERDIWIVDVTTGGALQVTFGAKSGHANIDPAWSSDGSRIAFVSIRNGRHGIYTKRADGSTNEELMFESPSDIRHLSWSPDSRFIVFDIDNPKTGLDVWAVPTTAPRTPVPIVQTVGPEHLARVSPDGKWLAHVAIRRPDGSPDVYVRAFPDGKEEWRASAATPCGVYPQWRGDSAELYFFSCGSGFVAVDLRAEGTSPRLGPPRTLMAQGVFSEFRSTYNVSPDGQRFLVLKEEPTR